MGQAEHQSLPAETLNVEGVTDRDQPEQDVPNLLEEQGQAEQIAMARPEGYQAEHQSLTGCKDEDAAAASSSSSSSQRDNLSARQPLTIKRAVLRCVQCPVIINDDHPLTHKHLGITNESGQAEQQDWKGDEPVQAELQQKPRGHNPVPGQAEQECSSTKTCHNGRAEHKDSSEEDRGQAEPQTSHPTEANSSSSTSQTSDASSSSSSSSRDNLYVRQPLTKQRAVWRCVQCPVVINNEHQLTQKHLGYIAETGQAEQRDRIEELRA